MKIGQVAREAGVSIDTVRFYERRGVLPPPQRRPSGYRVFTESSVERIRMARALQNLGFTLDEVIDALHAHDAGGATCESERWRLEGVVDRIDAKIAELRRVRRNTLKAIDECRAGRCRFAPPATTTASTTGAGGKDAARRAGWRRSDLRPTGPTCGRWAYRMLGSLSEADDAVQESWLHLSRSDTCGVANLGG
jgi:DNA-binding transcriptional MerR regulator